MKRRTRSAGRFLALLLTVVMLLSMLPISAFAITGDANNDGKVDLLDLKALLNFLVGNSSEMDSASADISSDGVADAGDIIPMLQLTESDTLKAALQGKGLAVMGDSISTYAGWSNNAAEYNSTIGSNRTYYSTGHVGAPTVDDTYWKQLMDKYDMILTCNNSISGSRVIGIGPDALAASQGFAGRPTQLHDDTVANNPGGEIINPDIICIYLGTNDHLNYDAATSVIGTFEEVKLAELIRENGTGGYLYAEPESFAEAYCIMLHKVTDAYPNAEVLALNLPLRTAAADPLIVAFNDVIAKAAANYGACVVDLYSSKLSGANYRSYSSDGVHPNAAGMDMMTEILEKTLADVYLN